MPSTAYPPVQPDLTDLLYRIRPAVRAEPPYRVGTPPQTSVKLNQNESPYDLPVELKTELAEAFRDIPFNRYPVDQPERLCRAFAEYVGHDPEGLLAGNGSNELTHTLALGFIEPGAPVVLPRPMFSLYASVVRLFGGEPVSVAPRADLSFDAEGLLAAIRERDPALVVLTSPNNPTGLAMAPEEIEAIVEAASGFVVVDEAYAEFNDTPSALRLLEDHPNVIVLRTLSKAFGLAGMRLGFLLARPAVIRELAKARLPFMVDRFAETTALTLLKRPDVITDRIHRLKSSCRAITDALRTTKEVEVVPSQTNFVLFRPDGEARRVMEDLIRQGVLVRNMSGYDELKGYLRVNAGTPAENKAFLAALEKALRSTAGA